MIQNINIKKRDANSAFQRHAQNDSPGQVDITLSGFCRQPVFENISIRPGIRMIIANQACHQGIQMDYDIDKAPVSFCYNLSQRVHFSMTSRTGKKTTMERLPGEGVLAYLPKTRGIKQIIPDKRIQGVSIHLNLHAFNELFGELPQCLRELYSICGGSRGKRFYHQSRFNGATFSVLKQILGCCYKDETRRLFFEAKSLELVALKLAELEGKDAYESSELNRRETDQVREAYDILRSNLDNPPGLAELSLLVGTNRNRLNHGFKEIYGDTVFNILRNARLSKAWTLLRETDLSIAQIALSVGYSHQANFTIAFRKQFGRTPKTVRKGFSLPSFSSGVMA